MKSGSSTVLPSSAKPSMNIRRFEAAKVRLAEQVQIDDRVFVASTPSR